MSFACGRYGDTISLHVRANSRRRAWNGWRAETAAAVSAEVPNASTMACSLPSASRRTRIRGILRRRTPPSARTALAGHIRNRGSRGSRGRNRRANWRSLSALKRTRIATGRPSASRVSSNCINWLSNVPIQLRREQRALEQPPFVGLVGGVGQEGDGVVGDERVFLALVLEDHERVH
jgi:hypothetical protein